MKKCYNYLILSLLFSLNGLTIIFAQSKKKVDERFGYHFKGKRQIFTKIPFEMSSNLIVVKVRIDNSDTLNFILDTGVTSTIISDIEVKSKLKPNIVRKVLLSGAGEGNAVEGSVSIGHTLELNDVIATQQNIVFLNEDVLQLSQFLGIPIHGIFGYDIFEKFVVTIDFDTRTIYLKNPSHFKYKKTHGSKYPIMLTQSKPYTDAFSIKNKNIEKKLRLVIDTGAGHALMLNILQENEQIKLPDKVIKANLGRGLSGEINGYLGRIQLLKVGKVELYDVITSFPDSISFSMKLPDEEIDRDGSIGCELLRRFKVTFNYSEGYLVLKPNKKRLKETFEHDMSGIDIRAKGEGFKRYFVEEVQTNSPANQAGILKGDELIFINNINVVKMNINDIYKILSNKEGKEVDLYIKREGTLSRHRFILKSVI